MNPLCLRHCLTDEERRLFQALSCLVLLLLFALPLLADEPKIDPALSKQIDKLRQLGARITLDDQKRVTVVNLSERRITDADLAHLRGFRHLQELDLTRTRITSAGLEHLKDLTTVRSLFLTETNIDDSGIVHLKGMKALGLIGLSGTKITDTGLGHLHALTKLDKVFCLGTSVTDAGEKKLQKALPKCKVTR